MIFPRVLFSLLSSILLSYSAEGRSFPAETTVVPPILFRAPSGPLSIPHSHNDMAQAKPLETALANGYRSIEVDVTDRRSEIRVTHLGFWCDGTLREMYLDRLQKLVDEKGSIYGDGEKFYLWIELRPFVTTESIVPLLRDLLPRYSMFTRFDEKGQEVSPGAVEAIVINSPTIAEKYFADPGPKPACRGVSGIPEKRPAFARWAYLRWGRLFNWSGEKHISKRERMQLDEIQSTAHRLGLKTRFWGAPESSDFWKQAPQLPFDLIGTDRLAETMETLRAQSILESNPGRVPASSKSD